MSENNSHIDRNFSQAQSRRQFLKNSARFGAGIGLALALPELEVPAANELNRVTTDLTGLPAGNAGILERTQKTCVQDANKEKCFADINSSPYEQIRSVVVAPVTEEILLRTVPSFAVSKSDNSQTMERDLAIGSGGMRFSRKEVIVGVATSITYGLLHNFTGSGINARTIPSSQIFLGAVNWILQRRFGTLAPILNHARFNHKNMNG